MFLFMSGKISSVPESSHAKMGAEFLQGVWEGLLASAKLSSKDCTCLVWVVPDQEEGHAVYSHRGVKPVRSSAHGHRHGLLPRFSLGSSFGHTSFFSPGRLWKSLLFIYAPLKNPKWAKWKNKQTTTLGNVCLAVKIMLITAEKQPPTLEIIAHWFE